MRSFIDEIELFDDVQPSGAVIKHIRFKFPIFFNDSETRDMCWDKNGTVETVVLIEKQGSRKS